MDRKISDIVDCIKLFFQICIDGIETERSTDGKIADGRTNGSTDINMDMHTDGQTDRH